MCERERGTVNTVGLGTEEGVIPLDLRVTDSGEPLEVRYYKPMSGPIQEQYMFLTIGPV